MALKWPSITGGKNVVQRTAWIELDDLICGLKGQFMVVSRSNEADCESVSSVRQTESIKIWMSCMGSREVILGQQGWWLMISKWVHPSYEILTSF